MKHLFPVLFLFISVQICAQSQLVNSFNYESTTRDTVIEFPVGDHNQYERILMHYSMRCKDGLVSTGSQRNLGCGEWDYSCNTYIVDSTRVDSLKAVSADHIIPGFSGDQFDYTNTTTYSYTQSTQYSVEYNNIITEDIIAVSDSVGMDVHPFGTSGQSFNSRFILKAENLLNQGLEEDDIAGMSFNYDQGEMMYTNLRVRMAPTADEKIDLQANNYDWQDVYYRNTLLNSDDNRIRFFENYSWDGLSNIAVELSYDKSEGIDLNILEAGVQDETVLINDGANSKFVDIGTSGHIYLEDGLESIKEEITVAFWQYGSDILPVNSTIFEGRDASDIRQVNVHLPWSNGQVYWDCGNDGGGYDRINKPANADDYKNKWNHWAFTKNAMTGEMHIYLNGTLWHSGTGKYKSIDIRDMNIGAAIRSSTLFYYGSLDEFQVWEKALSEEDIKTIMSKKVDTDHPDFNKLLVYYDFEEYNGNTVADRSSFQNDGVTEGKILPRSWKGQDQVSGGEYASEIPDMNIHQGLYFAWVEEEIVLDSVENLPNKVSYYSVEGTDLVLDSTNFMYMAGDYPVIDEEGDIVSTVNYPADGSIMIQELNYYSKSPMTYEIMSFVTPYGIGIDFGLDGHTWTFDVTEFGPLLKGKKRIYMSRGGQWQEEMDIRFEFIEGTPDRDVIDIQQIWPVTSTAYGRILDDWRFEPRTFEYDPSIAAYEIKAAITGHGQEGEFIPRTHILNIGAFTENWQVWKECADNPIYPQGGTWVYDRAGWCPGAATDVRYTDATEYFQFLQTPELDYRVQTASGDSRYIVNFQLIKYGEPNKSLDASILDVVHPTSKIEHGRFNPNCKAPVIILKNNGAQAITSATIEYGILGQSEYSFDWSGDLRFLASEEVELDFISDLLFAEPGDEFYARVVSVNNTTDEYAANDEYISEVMTSSHYAEDILIEFRTNFRPEESSYALYDHTGNILHARAGNLTANTTYRDTIRNLNGCYQLIVEDNDEDGLSWWANNDGNGYVRIKSLDQGFVDIATDFGKFVEYNFTAGMLTNVEELENDHSVSVFPNPSTAGFKLDGLESWDNTVNLQITDQLGKVIINKKSTPFDLMKNDFRLEGQVPGVYFIRLEDESRFTQLKWVKI
ncbi:MAG: T9SS type A sorting domain-containing protein [Saprospiraceae bacterium]|nr:T9SS type A sorting domain-containing protein [Saprospiraceae bacterium]